MVGIIIRMDLNCIGGVFSTAIVDDFFALAI